MGTDEYEFSFLAIKAVKGGGSGRKYVSAAATYMIYNHNLSFTASPKASWEL